MTTIVLSRKRFERSAQGCASRYCCAVRFSRAELSLLAPPRNFGGYTSTISYLQDPRAPIANFSTGDQSQENQVIKNAFPYQSQPRVSRVRTKPGEFEFDVIWQGLPSDRVVRIFAQSRTSGGAQNKIFINPWISHGAGAPADRVERRQTIRVSRRNGYAGVVYFSTNSTTRAGKIEDEVIGRQVINVPPKSGAADAVQREQSGGATATPGRNGYEPGFIPKPTGIPAWVIPAAGAAFVASRFMR